MPFSYHPLAEPQSQIRLIELLPKNYESSRPEAVHCRLRHISEHDPLPYNALSYVWGDAKDRVPISVEYIPPERPSSSVLTEVFSMRVTRNLETALRHIRLDCEPLNLWVDAICINQTDNQEKNVQVQKMGSIYNNADQVLVWLGPADDSSDNVMETFQMLSEQVVNITWKNSASADTTIYVMNNGLVARNGCTQTVEKKEKVESVNELVNLIGSRRLISPQSLISLTARPWWSRIWVLQELILARRAKVICGYQEMDSESFFTVLDFCSSIVSGLSVCQRLDKLTEYEMDLAKIAKRGMSLVGLQYSMKKEIRSTFFPSLLRAIMMTKESQATDGRDRVFALLGLIPDKLGLQADYSATCEETYVQATKAMLLHGEMYALVLSRIAESRLSLPSWAVDCSHLCGELDMLVDYHRFTQLYRAGGSTGTEFLFEINVEHLGHILVIKGIVAGKIFCRGPAMQHASSSPVRIFHEVVNTFLNSAVEKIPSSENELIMKLSGLWEEYSKTTWENDSRPSRLQLHDILMKFPRKATDSLTKEDMEYVAAAYYKAPMAHCCYFLTENGRIGLGPRGLGERDLVVIFHGVNVPFILQAAENGYYRMIGVAFLSQAMFGELMEEDCPAQTFRII